jgi:hypothetical protein
MGVDFAPILYIYIYYIIYYKKIYNNVLLGYSKLYCARNGRERGNRKLEFFYVGDLVA